MVVCEGCPGNEILNRSEALDGNWPRAPFGLGKGVRDSAVFFSLAHCVSIIPVLIVTSFRLFLFSKTVASVASSIALGKSGASRSMAFLKMGIRLVDGL